MRWRSRASCYNERISDFGFRISVEFCAIRMRPPLHRHPTSDIRNLSSGAAAPSRLRLSRLRKGRPDSQAHPDYRYSGVRQRHHEVQAVGKLDGRAPRNSCLATSAPWFMQPMWVRLVLISAENKWAPAETCLFRLGRVIFWPKMPRRHERKASDAGHRHRVGPDPDGGRRKNFP